MDLRVGGGDGHEGLRLSGTVGIVVMMGLLTLLPMLLLMMTGFTRILIVLNFLQPGARHAERSADATRCRTRAVAHGLCDGADAHEVNTTALTPWMDGTIDQATDARARLEAVPRVHAQANPPERYRDVRAHEQRPAPETIDDIPLVTLTSAFVISELRTAFQIGFALFLPFIVIDVAVSSVLMSMGMFMLPPAMISLPFKLLLFVLVDGWSLIVQSLVTSFRYRCHTRSSSTSRATRSCSPCSSPGRCWSSRC